MGKLYPTSLQSSKNTVSQRSILHSVEAVFVYQIKPSWLINCPDVFQDALSIALKEINASAENDCRSIILFSAAVIMEMNTPLTSGFRPKDFSSGQNVL